MQTHPPRMINRANLLGIAVGVLGLLVLVFVFVWSFAPHGSPERPVSELTFLEEGGKLGQGKGFRWWGIAPQTVSFESELIHSLIASRANLAVWSPGELSELSHYILAKSEQYKMSPVFVLSLIDVESRYQPAAISHRGAIGLLQLLPATAQEVATNSGMIWQGPHVLEDPKTNIELGLRYIGSLKEQFGLVEHALAAYNMGPAALQKKLQRNEEFSSSYAHLVMNRFSLYNQTATKKARMPRALSRKWSRAWL